jgi:hypothetical protein
VKSRRIVVVGTLAGNPYAGMAWMHLQIATGLLRLGHDVYYYEVTSDWPYDPTRGQKVDDSAYAVPYLARVAEIFGLRDRWAYRRSYGDGEWFGLPRRRAEEVLADADAAFNVSGATRLAKEQLRVRRWIYLGTDPVFHEVAYANDDRATRTLIDEHDDVVTYGENIGRPGCSIPPLPGLRARTRQPILLDLWRTARKPRRAYTTVGNWRQLGRDVRHRGETYYWSKHREFLRFPDVPSRAGQPIELATNLACRATLRGIEHEAVPALGLPDDEQALLRRQGWRLVDAGRFTLSPASYREYIQDSRGEFTVARDLNVRLRSGWFSERSACYLAAGRPVVTQDTGFGTTLPLGEGLFAFDTMEEIRAAFEAIEAEYDRHARAARALAEEHFRAETVLRRLLGDLGL